MTVQTEMSWRGKAGVAGVFGVGGASLPIDNSKNFFMKILRISSKWNYFSQEDEERVFLGENARASTPSRRVPARD